MPAIADQLPRSNGSEADLANPLSQPALPKGDTFDGVNFGELEYHFFKGQASTGKYEYTDVIHRDFGVSTGVKNVPAMAVRQTAWTAAP